MARITKLLSLLAMFLALNWVVSCSPTKATPATTTYQYESTVDSVAKTELAVESSTTVVDTTKAGHGRVVITEIEFFAPSNDGDLVRNKNDPRADANDDDFSTPFNDYPGFSFANLNTGIFGNVKAIRQTTIEADVSQNGITGESKTKEDSKSDAAVSKADAELQAQTTAEKPPAGFNWKALMWSLAFVAVALLLYLKRKPILNFLRLLLVALRRVF